MKTTTFEACRDRSCFYLPSEKPIDVLYIGDFMSNNEKIATNVEAKLGKGVEFERIRRITGYLVGTLDRFNDAKRAEEHDRIKHGM